MTTRKPMDLQAALKTLDAAHGAQSTDHQRRFKRFSVRTEARLWPGQTDAEPAAPNAVHLRDISRGGIGLLSAEPLPLGRFWQVQLLQGGVTIATMPAFCRFCHKVTDNAHLIGAEFGVQASIMMSLGVTASELAQSDDAEGEHALGGECVSPDNVCG